MIKHATYMKIMRASAIYDLVVTAPFMLPASFVFVWTSLAGLHQALALNGTVPAPGIYLILMANLLGSVVVVWSLARLWVNVAILGRFDAAARFLFALWQIVALMNGASVLLAGYLVIELVFGILQVLSIKDAIESPE